MTTIDSEIGSCFRGRSAPGWAETAACSNVNVEARGNGAAEEEEQL
jgi:hypothetical protein